MGKKALVSIVMGSDSDISVMEESIKVLQRFNLPFEVRVISAHRSPKEVLKFSKAAASNGIKVIIAGAGRAAHLAGVIASHTNLPVLGVPIDSSPLKGLDALLSTVQMPSGVPVATFAIGKNGAKNASIFAVRILSLENSKLKKLLNKTKIKMNLDVIKKDRFINSRYSKISVKPD